MTARVSALDRPVALRSAATEYARFDEALSELSPADWSRPTDCAGWDVRAMSGHVLGMAEMAASLPEQARQMRATGRRVFGLELDAVDFCRLLPGRGAESGLLAVQVPF